MDLERILKQLFLQNNLHKTTILPKKKIFVANEVLGNYKRAAVANLRAPNILGDRKTYGIDRFESFWNVKIFYNSKFCKKQMGILDVTDDWVICNNLQCNDQIRKKQETKIYW